MDLDTSPPLLAAGQVGRAHSSFGSAKEACLPSPPMWILGQRYYLKIRTGFAVQKALEVWGLGGVGGVSQGSSRKEVNGADERMDEKHWPLPAAEK